MEEDEKKKKVPEISDVFSLKLFGMDFGKLVKDWLGVESLKDMQDPAKAEEFKRRIEEKREELKASQEQFRKKFGDAVRFDYDIRVRTLTGGGEEMRLGGGRFFDALDQLAKEKNSWRPTTKSRQVAVPYKRPEGVRQPPVEIVEHKDHMEVIAELPGVEEKDIELHLENGKLIISVDTTHRKYRAETEMPCIVLQEPSEKTYMNGVLTVRYKKDVGSQKQPQ